MKGYIVVILILILAVILFLGVKYFLGKKVDTSKGLQYMKEAEETDASEVEKKIIVLEKREFKENDTRTLKEKFARTVVMGDSIAEGFRAYEVLNSSSVVAKIGVHLEELKGEVGQVKALEPEVVILAVGYNDVTATDGNVEEFLSRYDGLIEALRSELPDVQIFVNLLYPVTEKAIGKEPPLQYIDEYNAGLITFCEEKGISCIDNSEIYDEKYHEPDRIWRINWKIPRRRNKALPLRLQLISPFWDFLNIPVFWLEA